jgi:hypothetical protein
MNRRSFFGAALAVVPVGAAIAAVQVARQGLRVSFVKGDPGERLVGMAEIDGKRFDVYLDGVLQDWWHTADEAEGFVVRDVKSREDQPALNKMTNEWVQETIHGKVEVVFEDKAWLAEAIKPSVA